MTVSVFELFTVGLGPSSSHTVGPMRAAGRFVTELAARGPLADTASVEVALYGSLAATGAGHGTPPAVLLGLEARRPEELTGDAAATCRDDIRARGAVWLGGTVHVPLSEDAIARFPDTALPAHPNGLRFTARDAAGAVRYAQTYYSIGGGFVATDQELAQPAVPDSGTGPDSGAGFGSAAALLARCADTGAPVSEVMLGWECATRPAGCATRTADEVRDYLRHVHDVMTDCVARGVRRTGALPGGLEVRRRAPDWYARLCADDPHRDPALAEDWVNLVALAVNEENASGGRVVTAPTNGAAGIIPAVLHYATHYTGAGRADPDGVAVAFLLTAGAVGSLCKEQASVSGAEVGCQGEVGSAAAMAAAGLAEVLGGSARQVENAAEIALEHSLGMTCDPVGGLVQIPCIERNAISAGKAVNAARMALRGDGTHRVSLDDAIATMRRTGRDMSEKYKETSQGGLALTMVPVSVVDC